MLPIKQFININLFFIRMRFKAKKSYGNYKTTPCPFCQRTATHKNTQGRETCHRHAKDALPEIKCLCGSWLEQKAGKFGPYFNCANCGNINFKKGLEFKEITVKRLISETIPETRKFTPEKPILKQKKEITISSNDVEYFS